MVRSALRRAVVLACLAAAPALAAPAPAAPAVTPVPGAPASFADLAARLLPGVVSISSSQTIKGPAGMPGFPAFPPGSPFEKFFRDFMKHTHPGAPPPVEHAQALGSGFIIDSKGIIVTNNHVIAGADSITVILQDNTRLKATLLGRDKRTDLAVLRVHSATPLPFVKFGDSNMARVGDWVMAVGNPFGLESTVTAGIISARGRNVNEGPYDNFIQTDAPINKGNSGGPLFDMAGDVIGINTLIYSPSGGSVGIGFAIPSNMAKTVVAELEHGGKVLRGWLGVRIQQVTPDIADSLGLKKPEGALVAGVTPSGPAAKGGIRNGDVVLRFDGQTVKDMHALPRIVAATPIGKHVVVSVWRGGHAAKVEVTVGELPSAKKLAKIEVPTAPSGTLDLAELGVTLAPVDTGTRQKFHLPQDQKGVIVTGVKAGSAAAKRGLKAGDVILEVQQQEVHSPSDFRARVDAARKAKRKSVLVLVQSASGLRWVPLPLDHAASGKQSG